MLRAPLGASPLTSYAAQGTVHFPGGSYVATWEDGKAVDGEYVFDDGLKFVNPASEWKYCIGEDRRFHSEALEGILPAGETQLLNKRPSPAIPEGCYDAGDGYYDPKRGEIFAYDSGLVLRRARADEVAWITRKCAYGAVSAK